MKSSRRIFTGTAARRLLASCALLALTGPAAYAQQTSGAPGSPSATTTIDGKYLPNTPPKFGGEINLSAQDSKPYWQPQVVPPKGAPNVLLIMTDDAGYGVSGTFGGVIPTPHMDRIANMGCAIPNSIRPRCARRRELHSSPVATIIRSASA